MGRKSLERINTVPATSPPRGWVRQAVAILRGLGRFRGWCRDVPVLERCEQCIGKLLCLRLGLVDTAFHIDPIPFEFFGKRIARFAHAGSFFVIP